jgi:hypothetical protein
VILRFQHVGVFVSANAVPAQFSGSHLYRVPFMIRFAVFARTLTIIVPPASTAQTVPLFIVLKVCLQILFTTFRGANFAKSGNAVGATLASVEVGQGLRPLTFLPALRALLHAACCFA